MPSRRFYAKGKRKMEYRQPFEGDYGISQYFGETTTDPTGHKGIDYLCPLGTPVLASESGTVVKSGWDNTGYGYCVVIQHKDGNKTLYAHLQSQPLVHVGEKVKKSQLLGYSGSTGNSTGPHLHFEARGPDGKAFDPFVLPLHSSIEPVVTPPALPHVDFKEADSFYSGELLKVTAPLGVKAYYTKNFEDYTVYPMNTKFYYTGESTVRKSNGITYMRVVPATFSVWVAVHDQDTQILDKS